MYGFKSRSTTLFLEYLMAEKLSKEEMMNLERPLSKKVRLLIDKGVKIPNPLTVDIGELEYCKPMRFRVMRSHQTKTAS